VSHRRAVLQRADRILLLKEGRLEATGNAEQLLQSSEEFRQLWSTESV
jgi:ATP-binding cassette, subfamily B, bacterial